MGPFVLVIIFIGDLTGFGQPHSTVTSYQTAEECHNARNGFRAQPRLNDREQFIITCIDLLEDTRPPRFMRRGP